MKRLISRITVITALLIVLCAFNADAKEVRILFTHDIHSYLDSKDANTEDGYREHGNAARLATLVKQESNDHSIYVDAGDMSMGTLYQAGYSDGAYELRTLGAAGCKVTTFGNHEFDYGCTGLSNSLKAAMKAAENGESIPKLVEASFDFSGELTDEQEEMKKTLDEFGCGAYTIEEVGGVKIAFFGIEGIDSIECIQSDVKFKNYIKAAKETIAQIGDQADIIVALSHAGTEGDGETGEDFNLIAEVPEIDVVISGHSHTAYQEAIQYKDCILGSAGSYLYYLGEMDLDVEDGKATLIDYRLIPIDESVREDSEVREKLEGFKDNIKDTYLVEYAEGGLYDDVLAYCPFDFMSLDEMYATHQEYPIGNLIADSYMYKARECGIDDIDVALVGLGTVRGSFTKGNITLADAFEICSLGVGGDGSAGHPLLASYVTGEELKLLIELDASLGPVVSSIKMSYSGLRYTFNTARAILDRVTESYIVKADGSEELIEDDKMYKVCCNMYAANMLGMLNGLTRGALKIVPKYEDGTPVEDFYTVTLKDKSGKEIKEWVAFKDYIKSLGEIPDTYREEQGRKKAVEEHGAEAIKNPGLTTILFLIICILVVIEVFVTVIKSSRKIEQRRSKVAEEKRRAEAVMIEEIQKEAAQQEDSHENR